MKTLAAVVVLAVVVVIFQHWIAIGLIGLGGYGVGRLHGGYRAKRQLKTKRSHTLTEADWSA